MQKKNMSSSIAIRDIEETMENKMSTFQNYKKTYKKNLKSKEKTKEVKYLQKQWKKLPLTLIYKMLI